MYAESHKIPVNKYILLTTLYVLGGYALFDESINLALGRGFSWQDLFSGGGGIMVGILSSAAWARHYVSDVTPDENEIQV